jgi:hypothetical protein
MSTSKLMYFFRKLNASVSPRTVTLTAGLEKRVIQIDLAISSSSADTSTVEFFGGHFSVRGRQMLYA